MVVFDFNSWKKELYIHRRDICLSIFLIATGIVLLIVSGKYTDRVGAAQPGDLILDHIPVIDFSLIVVWLFLSVIIVYFVYPFVFNPKKISYMLGLYGVYLVIKSGFAVLTHLAAPAEAVATRFSPFYYEWFNFSNSLFFAGEVAVPFLGFLVFENKVLKRFFLISSIVLGVSTLFMHRHYSIDVLAAYFITYTIYKIGDFMFKDEK